MTKSDKTRVAIISAMVLAAIAYTVFAIWAIFINKYDEPQVYNMKFIERWDASHLGKGGVTMVSYKGYWKEEKSGNVIVLSISDYMMYRMHLGEVIPMSFPPSRLGLQEDHSALYGFFPAAWLAILSLLAAICGILGGGSWLFSFDSEKKNKVRDIYGS